MKAALIISIAVFSFACNGKKTTVDEVPAEPVPEVVNGSVEQTAPVVVYRTKTDHSDHVPVQLSDDKRSITGYPHPKDVASLPRPTDLGNGYWLDNRGIDRNVGFLSMSYSDYTALSAAPSLQQLDSMLIDRDPIQEFHDCGKRSEYKDLVNDLKKLVATDALRSRCKGS